MGRERRFPGHILHIIDESSMFHLARRLTNRHLDHAIPVLQDLWFSWAGPPRLIYSDPAGEFRAQEWLTFLQENNIEPRLSTEAWQKGRAERHGQVLKNMSSRSDQESTITSPQMLDEVLRACCQAKNALEPCYVDHAPQEVLSTWVKPLCIGEDVTMLVAQNPADGMVQPELCSKKKPPPCGSLTVTS